MRPSRLPWLGLAPICSVVFATSPASAETAPSAESVQATPAEASPPTAPPAQGFPVALRLGVSVVPVVGISARTVMVGGSYRINQGGFVPVDIAPGFNFSRCFGVELALSAMIPVQDAYGFPAFRFAVMPGIRFDSKWVYSRLGAQFMFGDGTRYAAQLSVGVRPWKWLYVGIQGFASTDLLGGLGPETGVRFDELNLVRRR